MEEALIVIGAGLIVGVFIAYLVSQRRAAAKAAASTGEKGDAAQAEDERGWLVGVAGDVEGRRYHLAERLMSIGRAPTNYIQVTNSEASRTHCQLALGQDGVEVTDMSSANGTFINDELTAKGMLRSGDKLRVGDAVFIFETQRGFQKDAALGWKHPAAGIESTRQIGNDLYTLIQHAVDASDGDVVAAAKALHLSPEHVQKVLRKRAAAKKNSDS